MAEVKTPPRPSTPYLLYVGSWAGKNKGKDTYQAALVFAAATAMAERHTNVEVKVALLGDAVHLIVDADAKQMKPDGRPDSLFTMIQSAVGKGVKIHC
jgi:predicted peroxiredoxin